MKHGDNLVIDLFAGAGGFSLGAHLAGYETAVAIEVDSDLASSYPYNFPTSQLVLADIRSIDPRWLLGHAQLERRKVAGVIGGPPCQGYSVIGKHDTLDPRNALVSDFFRFVIAIEPRFFLMENVPGMLREDFRERLDEEVDRLVGSYHIFGPLLFDAAEYGAATARTRALLVGIRDDFSPLDYRSLARRKHRSATVREAISDLPPITSAREHEDGNWWATYPNSAGETLPLYAANARHRPRGGLASDRLRDLHSCRLISGFQATQHTEDVRRRFANTSAGRREPVSKCIRLDWDSTCPTLRAGTGKDKGSFQSVRPIHPAENRVISVREAARLQGFPDWFQFHHTKWHSFRMIGNSVCPHLARAVLRTIRTHVG